MKKLGIVTITCVFVGFTALALIRDKVDRTNHPMELPLAAKMEPIRAKQDVICPVADKVAVSFSLVESEIVLHEPVILRFIVKNRLPQPIKLDLGQDRKGSFSFVITQPDGSKAQLPQFFKLGLSRIGKLTVEQNETYRQTIVLNEQFEFLVPGIYKIEAHLLKPIQTEDGMNIEAATEFNSVLKIEPRNAEKLKQVCAVLLKRLNASASYDEAAEAANELSYIKDPIAIPYLKEALMSKQMVELIAVKGLERIGSSEAIEALASAQKSQSPETVEELIKPALARIKSQSKRAVQEQD